MVRLLFNVFYLLRINIFAIYLELMDNNCQNNDVNNGNETEIDALTE